jgi:hypothetical protein
MQGVTLAIPMGPYAVTWRMYLLNSAGASIASTQSAGFQVTLEKLADLPEVAFSL